MPNEPRGTPPERILIVDDEPHIRRLLAMRLTNEGYEIREASDGQEALAALPEFAPDLVLLDLMLPGASGLEVLSRMHADAQHRSLPVVILTAKGQDSDRELAFAGGATDFVTKPFSPKKLLARIREILDAR